MAHNIFWENSLKAATFHILQESSRLLPIRLLRFFGKSKSHVVMPVTTMRNRQSMPFHLVFGLIHNYKALLMFVPAYNAREPPQSHTFYQIGDFLDQ